MYYPEFVINAHNVYRTKHYIVKQYLKIGANKYDNNSITSYDVFYKRTPERDKKYERFFRKKHNIDGKRLPSTMYTRQYKS